MSAAPRCPVTDAPATYAADARFWGQVGAPGTLFAPFAHIFRGLPGESARVAAPACCPDLPVAAALLVPAGGFPQCNPGVRHVRSRYCC